jgi:hypothetical protein
VRLRPCGCPVVISAAEWGELLGTDIERKYHVPADFVGVRKDDGVVLKVSVVAGMRI